MRTDEPHTVHLKDYQPPAYLIETVDLTVELDPKRTLVTASLGVRRNDKHDGAQALVLDGEELELVSLKLDGKSLASDAYEQNPTGLTIFQVPERFTLDMVTAISPAANTALEGLYMSKGMYCTQCEAEGFRKITFFPDRPDVLAVFKTRIIADTAANPVLLSNGNPIAKGRLEDGRHWVEWHDPFPKPCYLFALVAGDLACIEDRFTTMSGRNVTLRLFVEPQDSHKGDYALDSLKRAMRWDEETYGREYDLDIYMIVAVSHFNMGAMENKGLNVFNSQFVLANPATATDQDYEGIESVIAHEYFHNWTGNRITCRDWFQLCLKEGLTVFRDQQFSSDMRGAAIQRIKDVRTLRTRQFPEDAGPLAHPVRPESYMEINNFYTATVYEKGAEVIGMMRALLGATGFRKGMDLYFERHDGEAATVENFVGAMEDANGRSLEQFRLWYSQAGTPVLDAESRYDAKAKTFTLRLRQTCPPTPGQSDKKPMHIPIRFGLVGADGGELPLKLAERKDRLAGDVLSLTTAEDSYVFGDVPSQPVPSLLRGFSAPVKVRDQLSDDGLLFLIAHDGDAFNRWEAGRRFAEKLILRRVRSIQKGAAAVSSAAFEDALRQIVCNGALDPDFVAQALTLPSDIELAQAMDEVDPDAIDTARCQTARSLAVALKDELLAVYGCNKVAEPYQPTAEQAGRRALRNRALMLLASIETDDVVTLALQHFERADNMTDAMAALSALANIDGPARQTALATFYERWRGEDLVVNKWLALQATSRLPTAIDHVRELMGHESFDLKMPNRVRALIGSFMQANHVRFHDPSGAGYRLAVGTVLDLDPLNPQVAARLLSAFENWRRYDDGRQQHMKCELQRLVDKSSISKNVFEIVSKILK